jgi:hypothetical protein
MGNQQASQNMSQQQQGPPIQLQMRELATQHQVNTLLGMMGMLITAANTKQHNLEYNESSIPSEGKGLPGEALIAAENTFINVCERLDSILGDANRWDTTFQQKVEKDYHEAIKLNLEGMAAQKNAAVEIASPHARMNPTLVKLRTGDWAAFVGRLEHPSSIVGIGATPEACLHAFDEAFAGRLTTYTRDWLEKHGVEIPDQNANTKMAPQRRPNPERNASPAPKRGRNRKVPRPGASSGDNSNLDPS